MLRLSYPTETVLSNKITRNRIVLSFKDSPRKPLGRRPNNAMHRRLHCAAVNLPSFLLRSSDRWTDSLGVLIHPFQMVLLIYLAGALAFAGSCCTKSYVLKRLRSMESYDLGESYVSKEPKRRISLDFTTGFLRSPQFTL